MTQMFGSPASYVQGKDVLFDSVQYLEKLGRKPILMADTAVYKIVGDQFKDYLSDNKFDVHKVIFHGEASPEEIDRITGIASEFGADVIIGLGGGKTLIQPRPSLITLKCQWLSYLHWPQPMPLAHGCPLFTTKMVPSRLTGSMTRTPTWS